MGKGKISVWLIVSAALLLVAGSLFATKSRPARTLSMKGKGMIFETVIVGQLGVNCFVLGCPETGEGVVIDPGADPDRVLAAVQRHGLTIKYVINTHGHFDHIGGNRQLSEKTGAKLLIHEGDVPFLSRASQVATAYGLSAENSPPPDAFLADGMTIAFGRYEIRVLHTPGHTPGGCSLYLVQQGMVLTGDTLFAESVGRTDFPGSSHEALIAGIRGKLLPLPDDTVVYPGHGPSTTIGWEKAHNPYLAGN
jgi:hydroxyacylglutathione hydrolase